MHFNASDKKFKEYLLVCERLGKTPDPNKMPMSSGNFPYEVQLAFLIYELLPDRWEGMSGSYLGKDWGALGALYDIHNIEDKRTVTFFLKNVDILVTNQINKEVEKQHKQTERKSGAVNVPKGIK